jgi:hypothetical protein
MHYKCFQRAIAKCAGLASLVALAIGLGQPARFANAQSSSSSVIGIVTDPAGAIIPDATVILKNADTNAERKTVSNASGNYFFTNVPPARYTLIVSAKSFEREVIAPFAVNVAQAATVNASLKVGNAEETVTVTAENIEVESASAQLGNTIGTKAVNELPLNGRNFTQLLNLTPGISPISTGQNSSASNTSNVSGSTVEFPSINGSYNRSTLYLADGMNNNNGWYNTYAVPVIVDLIQEFKINSHSEAQYGTVVGGVVNMATKAGTNDFHGAGWEFARSNSFDAKPYLASVAPPSYHLNMYGFVLGGPIRVPHLYNGKDKTFFEIGYEATHYTKSGATNILIPTAAQLGEATFGGPVVNQYADFSTSSCLSGGGTTNLLLSCQLWDPTTNGNQLSTGAYRPAYTGNQIPTSEFGQYQLKFLSDIFSTNGPNPNGVAGYKPTQYNYQITDPTKQTTYNYSIRLDQHIRTTDFIFARFSDYQSRTVAPSTLPQLFSISGIPSQQYGASWTHIFSPTMSVQVQYARSHVAGPGGTLFTKHDQMWKDFGCDASYCNSFVGGAALLISQSVTGGFSGGESSSPAASYSSIHEWSGAIFKILGNHQLQAGGGWDQDNYTSLMRQGSVTYSGASTGNFKGNLNSPSGITTTQVSAQSGSGLLDFLLDYPNAENLRNVMITERPGGIGSIYVQDAWKVNQKLMLNYGFRYDRSVIPAYGTDASIGLQGSIETGDMDFGTGNYIVQKLPPLCSDRHHAPCLPSPILPANVVVAQGEKILHGNKLNISPRFSFAYRVNEGLSVRGGFGIFWDNWSTLIQMAQNYQGSWPDTGTLQINNTNTPGTVYTSAQNPFGSNSSALPAATPFTSSNVNYMVSPNWKNPYSEQYNFGIEKQLWGGNILGLNYVGAATHRMDVGGYYNTGTPCGAGCAYASFAARVTAGVAGQPVPYAVPQKSWDHASANASYNSLQVSLQHSYRSGLGYSVSYTWSKTLDEGSDGFFGAEGGVPMDPYNPKGSRGPAGFSVPQILTAHAVYELPVGTGKKFSTHNRFIDYAIGSWQATGMMMARSGQYFNVLAGGDIAETGNAGTYERAVLVGDPYSAGSVAANPSCAAPSSVRNRNAWFNPCSFVAPPTGTYGTYGRNVLHAQDYWNADTSLSRKFPLHEGKSFNVKLDAFNTFNHPVLSTPGATVTTASSFGVISGTSSSSRTLQFSGKLVF